MEQTFARVLSDDEIIALYWERNESAIIHTDINDKDSLAKLQKLAEAIDAMPQKERQIFFFFPKAFGQPARLLALRSQYR